jgi:hypothetical protein
MGHGMLAVLILALTAATARAEIVDRVAVSCGKRAITESAISLRIRLTAFQNGVPVTTSEAERREAAQQLVDQTLIEEEMGVGHYRRMAPERRQMLLGEWEKEHGNLDKLGSYGLTPEDLEEDLVRQEDLLTFLEIRFRPAVQVTESDIAQYFEENIRPAAGPDADLASYRARIEQLLVNERADRELEAWLRDQRKRTRIEYLEKELQ